jgi:hypothetical protein
MTVTSSVAIKKAALQQSMLVWLIFLLGFCTFLPVGMTYLTLIVLIPILLMRSKLALLDLDKPWFLMIVLILIWPILTLPFNYNENFWGRYGHSIRFALCILIAINLKYIEKIWLIKGFVFGGVFASTIILIHNLIVVLPEWSLWHQLLSVTGNASSQKWIMLAVMPAIFLLISLGEIEKYQKFVVLLFAVIAFNIVAYFSISRNSHIILIFCLLAAVTYKFRNLKYWIFAFVLMLALSIFSILVTMSLKCLLQVVDLILFPQTLYLSMFLYGQC